jgi:hypothetical protein
MTSEQNETTAADLCVLQPADIRALPAALVQGCPGVTVREVWRSGDLHDVLLSYLPGAATPGCPHRGADHHIWVVRGSASIAGRHVETGSYVHVPPGVAHPILATGPAGCLLLQVHRPIRTAGSG